jgi:heme exporter protein A
MITAKNLTLNIPSATPVAPLSFSLLEGQLLWVRGENGAGKSTLLKTLLGLMSPLEGSIHWHGESRPSLFYLPHDLGIQRQMTVLDYCAWHPAILMPPSQEACYAALKIVNLLPQAHQLAGHLSRGQQQRLLFACALLSEAKLWLLDEPFTALDIQSREILIDCLAKHRAAGGAAMIVSHYPLTELTDEVLDVLA